MVLEFQQTCGVPTVKKRGNQMIDLSYRVNNGDYRELVLSEK